MADNKIHSAIEFALGTFSAAGSPPFPGLVVDGQVLGLAALDPIAKAEGVALMGGDSILSLLEAWDKNFAVLKTLVKYLFTDAPLAVSTRAAFFPVTSLVVLPPINIPRQIFCSGANYFKHVVDLIVDQGPGKNPDTEGMNPQELRNYAENLMRKRAESGEPYMFNKPVSAVCGAQDAIVIPAYAELPDWELELAVVVGKPARNINRADAMAYVAGYTIANDITNRGNIYRKDEAKGLGTDWVSSKSSPTYLPLGPYFVPAEFVPDVSKLQLVLKLNGEIKQNESAADMIFDIPRQLEYLTSRVQLLPGDILCTGSPSGNGTHYNRFLQADDLVESSITGLGVQTNRVVEEG